jgi:hypothetical protein
MVWRHGVAVLAVLGLTAGCSESKLRAGHCEHDTDCPAGEACVLAGAATFTCAASDGGLPDGGLPDGDASEVAPECTMSSQCPDVKPICDAQTCRACDSTRSGDATACASRDGARPFCGPGGACVECVSATGADCAANPAKPICDPASNTCMGCATDGQCVAKGAGPGICMSHQDGRCASDSEVIYVENKGGCASSALTPMAGSSGTPFCSPQLALDGVSAARRTILISGTVAGFQWAPAGTQAQVSIFGRNAAVIAGGTQPGVAITGGADLYLRGPLTIGPGPEVGISAASGAILRVVGVIVDGNKKGGVLIDGAGFDLRDSTIVGNGPGDIMGFPWGGVRIQNAASVVPASLDRLTIRNNNPVGLSCSGTVVSSGVFATTNTSVDIATTCGITPCSPAGPSCGAP